MTDTLVVTLDGMSQLEYRRSTALAEHQLQYIDLLDQRMDGGIELNGRRIEAPNALQRAQFIALQLLNAVQDGNEQVAAATCAYLANRIPDLKQVQATTRGGMLSFDLIFDEAYEAKPQEVKVEFMKPRAQD